MTTCTKNHPATRFPIRRLSILAPGLVLLLGAGLILWRLFFSPALQPENGPPPDFQLATEVDLAGQIDDAEPLLALTLDEPAGVGIFYALHNVDTPSFELTLLLEDGRRLPLLRSTTFRTDEDGGALWEQQLPAGTHRLLLSAAPGQGTVAIYWGLR